MGIHRYLYQLCRIVQVFIYKQGNKKEVAKEGMPNLLNKKKSLSVLSVTAATPDTSSNEKEI